MAHASDTRFLVAHRLRVKGLSTPAQVAALTGLRPAAVAGALSALETSGHARRRGGHWSLTVAGRVAHGDVCRQWLAEHGGGAAVRAGYERFLVHDQPFMRLCTEWQLVDGGRTLNDHTDSEYDAGVIARLAGLHAGVEPVLKDIGAALDRFAGYPQRLGRALARIQSGEHDWFTGAMIDSYHTVWFELHEDLLTTLGIQRATEGT